MELNKNGHNRDCDQDGGFTLVELAIVMIIIGLLIGGILQGQNLIKNAQILSAANEIESFDAGIATFREAYGAWPGDMLDADVRLRNCTNICDNTGTADGNNRIGAVDNDGDSGNGENAAVFVQLSAADILTSVESDTNSATFGGAFPVAEIGSAGGYQLGFVSGANNSLPNPTSASNIIQGHYLFMYGAIDDSSGGFTPSIISRLDRKLDDGLPDDGNMRALGNASCTVAGSNATIYNETSDQDLCDMALRVQG